MSRPRLVITGGYGAVGRAVLTHAERYDVVVAERPGVTAPETLRTAPVVAEVFGDLADPDVAEEVVAGADYVVHLAANPSPRAPWHEVVTRNTAAAANVIWSAARSPVRSLVVASSVHAAGNSRTREESPAEWQPDPCCPYGLGKVLAETHARFASAEARIPVTCLRLGWVTPQPLATEGLGIWVSPEDAASLVHAALQRARGFGIYFGISGNTANPWPNHAAAALGYHPRHSSDTFRGRLEPLPDTQSCPQVFRTGTPTERA